MEMQSFACPYGHGETDKSRCLDRAAAAKLETGCLLCPVPVALIAQDGTDDLNRTLAGRLSDLITNPCDLSSLVRTKKLSPSFRPVSRGLGLARAVAHYLAKQPDAEMIPLKDLLPVHNAVKMALKVPDVDALAKLVRRQSLPVEKKRGRPFLVLSDHVRAFVRAHKEAA